MYGVLACTPCVACRWLVSGAEEGDSLFMHYSGESRVGLFVVDAALRRAAGGCSSPRP